MVYGVAAGAIRVLKHLAFRVLKNKRKVCLGLFDDHSATIRRPNGSGVPAGPQTGSQGRRFPKTI